MMKSYEIHELAYDYVITMSLSKKYNPQAMANINTLEKYGRDKIVEILEMPIEDFCISYQKNVVRDFVYKSDYFTPRNMFLISPLYYIYYTAMVFKLSSIYLNNKKKLDFSREKISVFYSGKLDLRLARNDFHKNAIYNQSYKLFQKERENYFGKPVLKLDIQDFFNSIKIKELLNKLKRIIGEEEVINDLEYFFKFCGFESLPQLHYSIGSSILSQFYLNEFDGKIQKMSMCENLHILRFVDDMYIIHLGGRTSEKINNNILNEISFFLWQDALVLNTKKTKMMTAEEFKKGYELIATEYGSNSFSSEKVLNEKAEDIINKGYLIRMINELCKIDEDFGIDLDKYKRLTDKYLSLNGEDTNKILNNIIFSKKWMRMKDEDMISLVKSWRYILFNPSQYTVLFLFVYRHLEEKRLIKDGGLKIRRILNYLYTHKIFTFRDTLVAVTYLFQSSLKNKSLLRKVQDVNPGYVEFINDFIMKD